jgi:hypothetical protein
MEDTSRPGRAGSGFDFASKGASRLVDQGVADMAVEIAIRTFRQAERPMHVNTEGIYFCFPACEAGASALVKNLRQLDEARAVRQPKPKRRQAGFSMLVISPKVRCIHPA